MDKIIKDLCSYIKCFCLCHNIIVQLLDINNKQNMMEKNSDSFNVKYYDIDLKMARLLTNKSCLPMVQKLYKS